MKTKINIISSLLAAAGILIISNAAYAQSVQKQLQDLDQRQKVLERKIENTQETGAAGAVVSAGKEGFSIKSPDNKFVLKLRGQIQFDGRYFIDLPQERGWGTSTFIPRSIRPILEGTLFQKFDFRLAPDFGNPTPLASNASTIGTSLQDAYIDARLFPEFAIRAGKFKEPVGLERLQSEIATLFAERSLATNLVPNRDLGFQFWGDINGGVISYAVGLFDGVADGGSTDTDNNDGKDFAGRVFAQPFLKTDVAPLKGLGVGIAGTYGKPQGTTSATALPVYRTPAQQTFFRYSSDGTAAGTALAEDSVYRLAPQLYYTWGPFSLQGEFALSTQHVRKAATTAKLTNKAWQTTASYVLTGENASYKQVKPRHPFSLSDNTWGAVEVVGRYHELRVDEDTFPTFASLTASASRARAFGAGVNWYLNDNVKLVTDFDHTAFKDGGPVAGTDRNAESVVISRVQLAF